MRAIGCAVAMMVGVGWLANPASGADAASGEPPLTVTDAAQMPEQKFSWGTLRWLCDGKLSPGAAQTVGIAEILPGQTNPLHYHPNCEEVLYVISGKGVHSFDGRSVQLGPGMTIRIPAGVKHNLKNTGTETIRCLISFSSGDRQTVFLEQKP